MNEQEDREWKNADTCGAWKQLGDLAAEETPRLRALLSEQRIHSYSCPQGGGLIYNFAAKAVDDSVLDALQNLSDQQELIGKYWDLLSGDRVNTGENRRVLHHLTRVQLGCDVLEQDDRPHDQRLEAYNGKEGLEMPAPAAGRNLRTFYVEQHQRVADFARAVRDGSITGSTGKRFTRVVQIGIGGSDLGPRALYLALKNLPCAEGETRLPGDFISNVDPDDAAAVLATCDPQRTLFVLVSKSGTTQETLTNEALVKSFLAENGGAGIDPARHIVCVTSETSPLADRARAGEYLEAFYIDDNIGGRYSSTSAVGAVILSSCFGPNVFAELLAGAAEADTAALNPNIRENAALLDALIGVWERNFLGFASTAVLPYSQALSRFPAHLQQLDMESSGKSVNRYGEALSYATGPVIFGEPGTNGQHSFYQLLHQGTSIVPLQFIGFRSCQSGQDTVFQNSSSQQKLNANLAAQITAFALGSGSDNPNKHFPGERPSSLLFGEQLSARSLGALLAHFENKVMFQGFVWNINSFDQEGVQLGKILTKKLLENSPATQDNTATKPDDSILRAFAGLLGL